jgi:hypothetical protein
MMQKIPRTHAIFSPSGGGGEGGDEQKEDKVPNTCQVKNLRPEQRKYWPIHITAQPNPTSHD